MEWRVSSAKFEVKIVAEGEGWAMGATLVPPWELLVHTPAVFVRVANKGVRVYGTWKSIRKTGSNDVGGNEIRK
jgi:hypothetical protein